MSLLKIAVEKFDPSQRSSLEILCEGESFSTAIFNSDIELNVRQRATYAENSHIVLSIRYYKAFIFNLLCVLISFLAVISVFDFFVTCTWFV